jgi:hypothetical protein
MGFGTSQMNVGAASGAVFVPENWSRDIEIARESVKVMAGLVNRRDFDASSGGDVIHIPFVSNLTTSSIASNGTANFQAPQESEVQVLLNRYWESSVAIEYRLSLQSKYELAMQYRGKIAEALDKLVETDLTGLYSSASQIVGSGSVAITEANIVRASQYLNDANAPMKDRHFVVCPAGMNNMQQIARFTEYQTTGEKKAPMVGGNNGLIGQVYEFDVHMTTNILGPVSTGTVIHHNLAFHKDFATLAMQKKVSVMTEDRPSYFATGYIATALWGFSLLRQDHVVDVQSKDN